MLGVNSEQKESMQHYISHSIYGLTLAWITSENSTKQLECRHLLTRSSFTGPYLLCYCLTAPVSAAFGWAVWHSCRMGARNQEQTRGRIGPQLRLGNLRVSELHFCPLCTALDQASSLSRKLAYVPGPTFGFVKLLASSGSHCTKWADEQHRQARFESRLVPDLPLPFIPTLIVLRAFDLVSSRVWWEAATNTRCPVSTAPVRGSTPTACQLLSPTNSLSRPLTTSGYGEISGPKILCLVSRQNRQRNRLLGGPPI